MDPPSEASAKGPRNPPPGAFPFSPERVEWVLGDVAVTSHPPAGTPDLLEVHVAAARHGGSLLLLGLVGDDRLGREEQCRDRGRVL